MNELKMYEFQAMQIKDTLRLVANINKCREKKTSFDRDVMQSIEMIDNILNGQPDKEVKRF